MNTNKSSFNNTLGSALESVVGGSPSLPLPDCIDVPHFVESGGLTSVDVESALHDPLALKGVFYGPLYRTLLQDVFGGSGCSVATVAAQSSVGFEQLSACPRYLHPLLTHCYEQVARVALVGD